MKFFKKMILAFRIRRTKSGNVLPANDQIELLQIDPSRKLFRMYLQKFGKLCSEAELAMLEQPDAIELVNYYIDHASEDPSDTLQNRLYDLKEAPKLIAKLGFERLSWPSSKRVFELPNAREIVEAEARSGRPTSVYWQLSMLSMAEGRELAEIWLSSKRYVLGVGYCGSPYPSHEAQRKMLELPDYLPLFKLMISNRQDIAPDVQDVLFTKRMNLGLLQEYVKVRPHDVSEQAQLALLKVDCGGAIIRFALRNDVFGERAQIALLRSRYAPVFVGDYTRAKCTMCEAAKKFAVEKGFLPQEH